jgi:L-phenylalanine/L-methionine N-acetyltransferase
MNRNATLSDFNFVYNMFMHPAVNPYLLYEQMSEADFTPIYTKLIADNVLYIYEADNIAVGIFKLVQLSYRCEHIVYLGSFAIHPNFGGKGLGLKMLEEIIAFAKEKNYKRLELSTDTENAKAIALYKKAGFEPEGILKKYTHLKSENRFIDELMMSYIMD